MRFELNPKKFDDWLGLHKLLSDSFAYMNGVIDPPSSLHSLTAQDLQTKAENETLLLAFDVEQLIGCSYFDIRDQVIYVGKIAVANAYRGRGLANQIIDHAAILAAQNNKKWLELETRIELTDNQKAFAKMGFVTTEYNSHSGYKRTTSITMRKKITVF